MSFLGDMFGGSPQQVSTMQTTSGPPAYSLPFLESGLERAEEVYQRPREYYPGQTYVDFAPATTAALDLGEARAMRGSPLLTGAQNLTGTVMGGGFLNPAAAMLDPTARGDYLASGNPYLSAALEPAIDRVSGTFSGAGRYGSGAHAAAMMGALAPTYAQNYASERRNQLAAQGSLGDLAQQDLANRVAAASAAPGMAQADYADIGQLAKFGMAREQKTAEALADDIARFNFVQSEEERRLQNYLSGVRGGTYGSSGTQPIFGDPTSSAIGNIGAVANIGKTIWDMM
jgi:hypothetical protein